MDKEFGYYVFGGLIIGAILGALWSANGNTLLGAGVGALAGVAIGWFIGAAVLQEQTGKKEDK
jgi:hypothetical protein